MTIKKKILGLSSSEFSKSSSIGELNFESKSLIEEGKKYYDDVIIINPQKVNYIFDHRSDSPQLYLSNGFDLSNISTLIVRGTRQIETSISLLATTLKQNGCDVLDPISRFQGFKSSKIFSTLSRHEQKSGTFSILIYKESNWKEIVKNLYDSKKFPLLLKPVYGRHGNGILLFLNLEEAILGIKKTFDNIEDIDTPLLLQKYMKFEHEYRIIIVNGQVIGSVEKITDENILTKNSSKGAVFKKVIVPNIESYVNKLYTETGILGVDIAITKEKTIHVIEANRAPQWQAFETATGINVAEKIILSAVKRL